MGISPTRAGVLTVVTARGDLGANDHVFWGNAGEPGAIVPPPLTVGSYGGIDVTASQAGSPRFSVTVEDRPGSPTPDTGTLANFTPGDFILTSHGPAGAGPLAFEFAAPVRAVGTQIGYFLGGPFVVRLEAFDAAGSSLGFVDEAGRTQPSANGKAIFLGVADTAEEIARVEFTLRRGDDQDIMLNTLSFLSSASVPGTNPDQMHGVSGVPEPSSLVLACVAGALVIAARRRRVLLGTLAGLMLAPAAWAQERPADRLASRDREVRLAAVNALVQAGKVPDAALPKLVAHVRGEIEQAMAPASVEADDARKLPIQGDEVPPSRLKAEPAAYRDKPFVLSGGLKAGPSIPGDGEPFAFELVTAGPDMRWTGDRVPVKVARHRGAVLADRVARLAESDPDRLMPVRLRCEVESGAVEAVDWQFPAPGGGAWLPWAFKGFERGLTAIGMANPAAASRALLDIVLDEREFRTADADRYFKASAILSLLELPARDRPAVARLVATRGKRARSAVARHWAQVAHASLVRGELVGL